MMSDNIILPQVETLEIGIFSQTLSKKYLAASYKLYWFAGILEEIKKGRSIISFRKIVSWMVAKSWYSLLQFKLSFGVQDHLHTLVNYVYEHSDLNVNSSEAEIMSFFKTTKNDEINKKILHFYKLVPYRFLTPFYSLELRKVAEAKRNATIQSLSNELPKFYRIQDESIFIIKPWFDYLYKNQIIVSGWIAHKLITFLQSRNPNVPAISEKLYPPNRRSLSRISNFWKEIIQHREMQNIYDKTILSIEDLSIDHFIPWSFVHHDKIWNLVPVSNSINSMKNDKLPELDRFLNEFIKIQYEAFKIALKRNHKLSEDYCLLANIKLHNDFPYSKFESAMKSAIVPLHQLAKNQGFQIWNF